MQLEQSSSTKKRTDAFKSLKKMEEELGHNFKEEELQEKCLITKWLFMFFFYFIAWLLISTVELYLRTAGAVEVMKM